jgi:hypothetical protein
LLSSGLCSALLTLRLLPGGRARLRGSWTRRRRVRRSRGARRIGPESRARSRSAFRACRLGCRRRLRASQQEEQHRQEQTAGDEDGGQGAERARSPRRARRGRNRFERPEACRANFGGIAELRTGLLGKRRVDEYQLGREGFSDGLCAVPPRQFGCLAAILEFEPAGSCVRLGAHPAGSHSLGGDGSREAVGAGVRADRPDARYHSRAALARRELRARAF